MAKNSIDAYGASGKTNVLMFEPEKLHLVTDKAHPLYDGLIAAVNRLLDSDGSRGCYSAIRCHDARAEVERLLAAAPQEEPDGK